MKTIFRFLSLAVVFAGLGASAAFAQDACADVDGQTALYTKVTETYNKTTIPERKIAVETGKQFLEKYGACTTLKEQIDFVKAQVPASEKWIAAKETGDANKALFAKYDGGVQAKNYDNAYAAGKDILAKQPDNLNILVPLGVIGLYQSYDKNYKYNDDSLRYAQQALTLLNSGKELPKKNKAGVPTAGVFELEYTKEEAISELTYALGYINFYAKNDKKAALPYYYQVSKLNGRYKTDPRVYATIGSYYIDDAAKLGQEIAGLIAKQKAAATEAEKTTLDTEIKGKVALFNGYTERTLDAYSRAYSAAKSDTPANKTYKEGLYKIVQDLYKRRFDKTEGVDAYVSSTVAKPLPNPTLEVTPVTDPEPVKTTSSTVPTSTPQTAVVAPKVTVVPPAASAKPAAATTEKTAAATTAKKPVTGVRKNRK